MIWGKNKLVVLLPLLLLAATVFYFWPHQLPVEGAKQGQPAATAKKNEGTPKEVAHDRAPPASAGNDTGLARSARTTMLNESVSATSRFLALLQLSAGGDFDAMSFAQQLAIDCTDRQHWANSKDMEKNATPAQRDALARLSANCAGIYTHPKYLEIVNGASIPMSLDIKDEVQNILAKHDTEGALSAAMTALKSRPDEATITTLDGLMTRDAFGSLAPDTLTGAAATNPRERSKLLDYALNLLACDFGRDCGPDSSVVLTYCVRFGACVPGANLSELYATRMLSGEEMDNVKILLALLQRVPVRNSRIATYAPM
ncbi:MAG: hypothetical protein NVS9B2_29320 [Steroidobacteraceae bacterium]